MSLSAVAVTAGYGNFPVLDTVDIDIPPGRITGLTGPSGSGKSTLARVLSLLHPPTAGSVIVDGHVVDSAGYRAPAELRRRIGVVFQSPRSATDPRWTLRRIIDQPLRHAGVPDRAARVRELADRVHLTSDLLDRYPHQVSDGQLQRACLARAVALTPAYLICDEATAMLDPSATATIAHLVRVLADAGAGVLAVSHDTPLLAAWADHIHHIDDLRRRPSSASPGDDHVRARR